MLAFSWKAAIVSVNLLSRFSDDTDSGISFSVILNVLGKVCAVVGKVIQHRDHSCTIDWYGCEEVTPGTGLSEVSPAVDEAEEAAAAAKGATGVLLLLGLGQGAAAREGGAGGGEGLGGGGGDAADGAGRGGAGTGPPCKAPWDVGKGRGCTGEG